ncbi:rhodanese-like domain-containing protein [Streptomyces sp. NBC_01275]|uniref:sulfurtransferase n=1 Tax=Streptomyces sp. NBC_01275 TaxID=2903807 RepID=UPI002258A0CE|nr:rhodanese-like domain-containing protein [Streptomyces sp. NBC_01275]MCX4759423.1 rhodanese-like domain-containing protein [Streptomyces sp. NBC_01275]
MTDPLFPGRLFPGPLLPGPLVDDVWLAARLGDPRLVVLDATALLPSPRHDGDHRSDSGRAEWAERHIPGSRHADLTGELSDPGAPYHFAVPAPEALAAALGRLGVRAGSEVVAYDSGGGIWAARLWWMLRSISVPVAVLDGGWQAWEAGGHPIALGEETGREETSREETSGGETGVRESDGAALVLDAGPLIPVPRPGMWVGVEAVEAVSRGERPGTLVCALPPGGFDGSAPTRYRRRGHIPGSLSLPGRGLLDGTGRFLPAVELAERVGTVIEDDDSPVILYCGGGISAAGAALALTLLGRQDIALYDGSLEEWSQDPSRPLTTEGP